MRTSRCLQRTLTGLLALLLALGAHAQPARAPRQLIDGLNLEVRKILEDPKSSRTPEDAERVVADQITELIRSTPGHLSLTQTDRWGRTPLMLAVSSGYPLIVQALLADPSVQLTVSVADVKGETAWMLAQFAPSVTLVACQPASLTLDRAQLLPPYLRRMVHLLNNKGAALLSIIQALEAAGAEAQPEAAKRAWLARCPNATPELRQAIAGADLLPTLLSESFARQREFNKAAKDNIQSVPAKPPEGMKFFHGDARGQRAAPASALLSADSVRCLDMPKPPIPRVNWTGEMLFKAVVSTRAGIVETVDFERTGDKRDEAVRDLLQAAILRAMSGYRCEGDWVFEQEFQFKYS